MSDVTAEVIEALPTLLGSVISSGVVRIKSDTGLVRSDKISWPVTIMEESA